MGYIYKGLTNRIIRCSYNVYDHLGRGFLESVYENALLLELTEIGLEVEHQKAIDVYYRGEVVGEFRADLIVEQKVLIELKAVSKIVTAHGSQLVNYLKATKIRIGLLINFGEQLTFKRKIY